MLSGWVQHRMPEADGLKYPATVFTRYSLDAGGHMLNTFGRVSVAQKLAGSRLLLSLRLMSLRRLAKTADDSCASM